MVQQLQIKTTKLEAPESGDVFLYVGEGEGLGGYGEKIWQKTGMDWDVLTSAASFTGKKGQVLDVLAPKNIAAGRLVVLGLGNGKKPGDKRPASLADWANLGGDFYRRVEELKSANATIILDDELIGAAQTAEFAAGMRLRHYKFDKYKTSESENGSKDADKIVEITLAVTDKQAADAAIKERMARVEGTLLARDLVNEPANVLGPVEFAKIASSLSSLGLEVEILEPEDMEKLGMGSLLSVAQGSARPARLAIMVWNGGKKDEAPLAFVGKGVVFDSGGISIKPSASMQDMKGDMGGAAAVIGLMKTLALRKAPLNAVGAIGLVENMPSGKASRPGDIVAAMSGTTIEIINTDAEGRLVLADVLWYTQDRFKPRAMINLATLTGAVMVALGHENAGLFSNNDELADQLLAAGKISGETLWRLPLGEGYEKLIKSRFADIKNTGGRNAGSITAAQFLAHFVNDVPWAHLDIAGVGFGTPNSDISRSWALGFGVGVLDQLVKDNYES
ncbi:Cytosol aminopeptidase PepA [hydrothermal vent metagenome]|uniref:leucyl aminopeptidase n=1 Tax=hydrothermal vent metagenome TaxID=652676 RepID=A0A3B0TBA2_9ZZZZ